MKLVLTTLALLIVAAIAGTGKAATEIPVSLKPGTGKILCPEQVSVRQKLVAPARGWDFYTDSSNPVEAVYLYYADPSGEEAIITEDSGMKVSNPTTGMWMVCAYEDTEVRVARPLGVVSKGCRYLSNGKRKDGNRRDIGAYCE